jgi:hypothetical protein
VLLTGTPLQVSFFSELLESRNLPIWTGEAIYWLLLKQSTQQSNMHLTRCVVVTCEQCLWMCLQNLEIGSLRSYYDMGFVANFILVLWYVGAAEV